MKKTLAVLLAAVVMCNVASIYQLGRLTRAIEGSTVTEDTESAEASAEEPETETEEVSIGSTADVQVPSEAILTNIDTVIESDLSGDYVDSKSVSSINEKGMPFVTTTITLSNKDISTGILLCSEDDYSEFRKNIILSSNTYADYVSRITGIPENYCYVSIYVVSDTNYDSLLYMVMNGTEIYSIRTS
jgi:hypothetical protein